MLHYDLPIDERLRAPVTFEAVSELINWYADGNDPPFSPYCLRRDLKRQLGEEGRSLLYEIALDYDPPLRKEDQLPGDPRIAPTFVEWEQAFTEEWTECDITEHHLGDVLLIDELSRAREEGMRIRDNLFFVDDLYAEIPNPTPVRVATELILDDLARRSGAKRAAAEAAEQAAEEAAEAAHQTRLDAEAAADKAAEEAAWKEWDAWEDAVDALAATNPPEHQAWQAALEEHRAGGRGPTSN
jgi:hypothetical protein